MSDGPQTPVDAKGDTGVAVTGQVDGGGRDTSVTFKLGGEPGAGTKPVTPGEAGVGQQQEQLGPDGQPEAAAEGDGTADAAKVLAGTEQGTHKGLTDLAAGELTATTKVDGPIEGGITETPPTDGKTGEVARPDGVTEVTDDSAVPSDPEKTTDADTTYSDGDTQGTETQTDEATTATATDTKPETMLNTRKIIHAGVEKNVTGPFMEGDTQPYFLDERGKPIDISEVSYIDSAKPADENVTEPVIPEIATETDEKKFVEKTPAERQEELKRMLLSTDPDQQKTLHTMIDNHDPDALAARDELIETGAEIDKRLAQEGTTTGEPDALQASINELKELSTDGLIELTRDKDSNSLERQIAVKLLDGREDYIPKLTAKYNDGEVRRMIFNAGDNPSMAPTVEALKAELLRRDQLRTGATEATTTGTTAEQDRTKTPETEQGGETAAARRKALIEIGQKLARLDPPFSDAQLDAINTLLAQDPDTTASLKDVVDKAKSPQDVLASATAALTQAVAELATTTTSESSQTTEGSEITEDLSKKTVEELTEMLQDKKLSPQAKLIIALLIVVATVAFGSVKLVGTTAGGIKA